MSEKRSVVGRVAVLGVVLASLSLGAEDPAVSKKIWVQPRTIRVAAIQMEAELGEVERNLERSERLVGEAFAKGAEWVVLPEMFTSAMAVHPKMLDAIRPADGEPLQFLIRLAREHTGVVGGSFLAFREGNAYNRFVLAFPDGRTFIHDKDEPTLWENRYYVGGSDDGVLDTPVGPVGSALCAEMFRARTAKRLLERVGIVLAGSCWWTSRDPDGTDRFDQASRRLLQSSPQALARMLGVPVVHSSHVGTFEGFNPEDDSQPYRSRYLGETQIIDGTGHVLARMGPDDGEGVIVAEVESGLMWGPRNAIPQGPWIKRFSMAVAVQWLRQASLGRRYYGATTLPYLIERMGAQVP